jgi:DNA-binding NarL/FixJ family response regulator
MNPPRPGILDKLTPAERMVAVHLAQGLSTKEIATALGKAAPTVKCQISAILHAAKVPSRARFIASYHQQCFSPPAIIPAALPNDNAPPIRKDRCA